MTSVESYEVRFRIQNFRHALLITLHYEDTTMQLQLPIQNAVRKVHEYVFCLYTYQSINTMAWMKPEPGFDSSVFTFEPF